MYNIILYTMSSRSRDAFAIIHFGGNPMYLELELYFLKMLRQYTRNDILYLYSVNDTPPSFVEAITPLVTDVVPYDDRGITYDVKFKSIYTNFNILRTCNFIFAYNLEKYDKVCIIESDMVIMKNLDSIFNLKTPAVLTYYVGDRNISFNDRITNSPRDVLSKCQDMGRLNGGIMLIYPSKRLFDLYKAKIGDVIERNCKYPNETLFEYVNNTYYNLPVQYNLSHYHAKPQRLYNYQLDPRDIFLFHFNETAYKHIDIIKNPVDEKGENWLETIGRDKKYVVKKLPIFHYKTNVYDRYRGIIEPIVLAAKRDIDKTDTKRVDKAPIDEAAVVLAPIDEAPNSLVTQYKPVLEDPLDKLLSKIMSKPVVDKPVVEEYDNKPVAKSVAKSPITKPKSPIVEETIFEAPIIKPKSPIVEAPIFEAPIVEEPIVKPKSPIFEEPIVKPKSPIFEAPIVEEPIIKPKSPIVEEPIVKPKSPIVEAPIFEEPVVKSKSPIVKSKSPIVEAPNAKSKKCPKGTRRNKKTGLCEPSKKSVQAEQNINKTPTPSPSPVPSPIPSPIPSLTPSPIHSPIISSSKKCPKGTRRNKKTGLCEPTKKPAVQPEQIIIKTPSPPIPSSSKKCPKGTRRNKKTGLCEPTK